MAASSAWLLLIHQIPPKPDYLRVKFSRRLQRVGAVAIKNSVYVLPTGAETREDFEWVGREIREAGGDALVAEAELIDGLDDAEVRGLFTAACDADYVALLADGRPLLKRASGTRALGADRLRHLHQEVAKLRRRFEAVRALDFFRAEKQGDVQALVDGLQQRLAQRAPVSATPRGAADALHGRVWVTRRGVKVDRIACAWLIRRFIDPGARFRFVDEADYTHRARELRFDMQEGEYTHVGDACSFETLATRHVAGDSAVMEIGEIVHDVDCKDAKFQRDEAGGLRRMIEGIVAAYATDEPRIDRGAALFDDLYAAFAR